MKKLVNIVLLFTCLGCSRCKDDAPDLCDAPLDRSTHLYNYCDALRVDATEWNQTERLTIVLDTVRIPGTYLLRHSNVADSVMWLLEGESKWRKGKEILVLFDRLFKNNLLVKKRVWGDKRIGCNQDTLKFYQSETTLPVGKRIRLNPMYEGTFEGREQPSGNLRVITTSLIPIDPYEFGYKIDGLVDFWPIPSDDILSSNFQQFEGDGIYYLSSPLDRSKKIRAHLTFHSFDSISIVYQYGLDWPNRKEFKFNGKRVKQ